ncbi:hypothetical protein SPRG_03962 [Saprolegnia parasitica CBS 223.65]|uniref:Uncharacterized protein n=1 Tax=Saprolegnia parasitica (strain CBS 223.65) TaxID=695850 RepID=A0A067CQ25_SAPPC|nr:hypothetical protein SPRG_03962 [Saprolegnia parasitica CBS 223.65]KDO31345.1 hypothetical protein SPRG_03962 [Saprolegnia parasitica CBS 223.65]|eukprot:XP_012197944.1 hypothetical protein SPRG_03962 [Saprolegnia parasitica CBS 223.65]
MPPPADEDEAAKTARLEKEQLVRAAGLKGTNAVLEEDEWLGKAILLKDCDIEQLLGHNLKSCKTLISCYA